jgi:ferredoxin
VNEGTWQVSTHDEDAPRFALVGVRACELAAISIQDRVFVRSDFTDPIYKARRESLFIIAVNCLDPDTTCFCTSMGTGPRHSSGYDLCLTELDDVFLIEVGSELGGALIQARNFSLPSAFMQNSADLAIEQAISSISRKLDTTDLPELLVTNLDAEQWTEVGKRCLSCANCTLVCPTCFCWDVSDRGDFSGTSAGRIRVWDSCFNPNYSYVFGGNTRPNIRSRYRQWLTHKLGTWKEQFGVLGCVGCGRCITWCPAGIDLTQEIASLRAEATK